MLSGDNGVLQRATDAKIKSDEAQIKERIQLAYHSALAGGKGSYTRESLEDELEKEFGENNYNVDDSDSDNWILTAKVQEKEQSVTIPAGKKEIIKTAKFVDDLSNKTHSFSYSTITKIQKATEEPTEQFKQESNIVSTDDSDFKIYMWEKDNILYWYSEYGRPELPENSSYIFASFIQLDDASGITDWNSKNVTNMLGIFGNCSKLTTLDISKWNTANVSNMNEVFSGCFELSNINISNWNTENVTSMQSMFSGCFKLETLNLSGWKTNEVTDMASMFYANKVLTKIIVSDDFKTDNVTNSTNMFGDCPALVGENGTSYDETKIDKTMAHIDVEGNPGYFSSN